MSKKSKNAIVLASKEEQPEFVNICTLTKPVYTAYLRGIEPNWKKPVTIFFMAIGVLIIAYAATLGWRLDYVAIGLFIVIFCGLAMGQPWMMARSKTNTAEERFGGPQKNITRFYNDRMAMQNMSAGVEAEAPYTDINKLKETEDFFYMYVGRYCYFAIKTGFIHGEEQIDAFREFISKKAVNANGHFNTTK